MWQVPSSEPVMDKVILPTLSCFRICIQSPQTAFKSIQGIQLFAINSAIHTLKLKVNFNPTAACSDQEELSEGHSEWKALPFGVPSWSLAFSTLTTGSLLTSAGESGGQGQTHCDSTTNI